MQKQGKRQRPEILNRGLDAFLARLLESMKEYNPASLHAHNYMLKIPDSRSVEKWRSYVYSRPGAELWLNSRDPQPLLSETEQCAPAF